ncbi:hypothetical protein CE91St43_27670 [Oscillospiraceae bacterium]|nr:hypothetical protein CE91St43_27670 [Oscillospiraceae bacterium]
MNERIAVTLDFTSCKYIPELFREMRRKMDWDEDFGENLSALWDILRGMPYRGDDFTIIRPVRFEGIPHGQDDIFTEYVDKICAVFQRAQERYGDISITVRYTDCETGTLSSYLL